MTLQMQSAGQAGGVGLFVVRGNVTQGAAPPVLEGNDRWVRSLGLPSQVVCYADARLLLDPLALCQHALVTATDGAGGLSVPTALVVAADDLEGWRLYAGLMTRAGIMRAAFTSRGAAQRWAQEQAALWAAQMAHRTILRAGR